MMKKIFILALAIGFALPQDAEGQRWRTRRYEANFGGGIAQHYGDIGGSLSTENYLGFNDIQLKFTRPVVTAGFKYRINRRFYARANLASAYLSGNDKGAAPEATRANGGYAFKSLIFEPAAMVDFYILPEGYMAGTNALFNRKGMINGFSEINLYVFTGVGGVLSFPKVTYINTGEEVIDDGYLPPDAKQRKFGLVLPFGIGIKYNLSGAWTASVEYGRRYSFTDNIDGYTSKFSKANDMYDFTTFTVGYKIRTDRRGRPIIFRRSGLQ